MPKHEPVYPWISVISLEDEDEETAEAGQAGGELELCEIAAAHSGSRFKVGETVLVSSYAYHGAERLGEELFVPEDSIRSVVTSK